METSHKNSLILAHCQLSSQILYFTSCRPAQFAQSFNKTGGYFLTYEEQPPYFIR